MSKRARFALTLGQEPNRLFRFPGSGGEDQENSELPGLVPDVLEGTVVAVLVVEDDGLRALGDVGFVAIVHILERADGVSAPLDFLPDLVGLGTEQTECEDADPIVECFGRGWGERTGSGRFVRRFWLAGFQDQIH